jgi:hypothetical protein
LNKVPESFSDDRRRASPGRYQYGVTARDMGLAGAFSLRDLWREEDLGPLGSGFHANVPGHGVVLLKVIPQEKS